MQGIHSNQPISHYLVVGCGKIIGTNFQLHKQGLVA